MNKFKKHLPLVLILVLAIGLRLFKLGEVPAGFFRDEAAIGYNAYSIWQTGRDEFGMRLPLVFRSFEVFFLPFYIYLSAPIIWILGLSEFSTRLLSALSGIVAVYLAYLIGKKLWGKRAGLFSAFILAIVPWHIYYSRGTFEGNLALTLFTAGFYFWLRFTDKYQRKFFLISTLFFALSMYSYQAERLVVPLFAIAAIFISGRQLSKIINMIAVPVVVLILILIPLLSLTFSAGGLHRASGVSLLSQSQRPVGWVEDRSEGILINNPVYLRGKQFLALYVQYFSPRNLFVEGDFDRQRSVDDYSVFYAFLLPFLTLGFFLSLKKHSNEEKLLLAWTFIAPLPAAATADPFHTYRSLLLYMPLTLFIGKGISIVSDLFLKTMIFKLRAGTKSIILWTILVFFGLGSLAFFIFNYVFLTQATRARRWDNGYKEIVRFAKTLPEEKRIVIDDPWTEAYIHLLFFGRENPLDYQIKVAELGDVSSYYYSDGSEIRPSNYKNFEFRRVDWSSERGDSGTVFIMWHEALPDSEFKTDPNVRLLKEIYYPDGKVAYKIVEII